MANRAFEIIGDVFLLAGISGVMVANGLFFIRHSILARYGCSTGLDGLLFPGLDSRLFRQLADAVDSDELRKVFRWINLLIPGLGLGGIAVSLVGSLLR